MMDHNTLLASLVGLMCAVLVASCQQRGPAGRLETHEHWSRVAPRSPARGELEPGYVARMLREDPLAYFDFRDLPTARRGAGALVSADTGDVALIGSAEPVRLEVPAHASLDRVALSVLWRPAQAEPGEDRLTARDVSSLETELVRYELDGEVAFRWSVGTAGVRVEIGDQVHVADFEIEQGVWNQLGVLVTDGRVELTHGGNRGRDAPLTGPVELAGGGIWSMRCQGGLCDELSVHDMPVHPSVWWQALSRRDVPPAPSAAPSISFHQATGHSSSVTDMAFAPDGATLVSASYDGTAKIWDVASGLLLHSLEAHDGALEAVRYSPDGAIVATASADGTARLWDVYTGHLLHTLSGHDGRVVDVAFHPEGALLATGSDDATVNLWSVRRGRLLRTLEGHEGHVTSLTFGPLGETLASASRDHTVRVWDPREGTLLHVLEGHADHVNAVAYCKDRDVLVTGSSDHTAKMWDVGSGRLLQTLTGHLGDVTHVECAAEGATVLTASHDETVRSWDARTGKHHHTLGKPMKLPHAEASTTTSRSRDADGRGSFGPTPASTDQAHLLRKLETRGRSDPSDTFDSMFDAVMSESRVSGITISPSGSMVAVGRGFDTTQIWDTRAGVLVHTLQGMGDVATFSPDGSVLVLETRPGALRTWRVGDGRPLNVFGDTPDDVRAAAYDPSGAMLAMQPAESSIELWSMRSGRVMHTLEGHTRRVTAATFTADGATLATGSEDRTVRLWDTRTGWPVHVLEGHRGRINAVTSCVGALLVTGSDDRTAVLWDMQTGRDLHALVGHEGPVTQVECSDDGALVATVSRGSTGTTGFRKEHIVIRSWDARTGKELHRLYDYKVSTSDVAFGPDGSTLVIVRDTDIGVWDARTGALLHTLDDVGFPPKYAFSPRGDRLVTGSDDHTVTIWDTRTGQSLRTLEGHADSIEAVAFAPSGDAVASGSRDGAVMLWDAASGAHVASLDGAADGVSRIMFGQDGRSLTVVTPSGNAQEDEPRYVTVWEVPSASGPAPTSFAFRLTPSLRMWSLPGGEFTAPEDFDLDALNGSLGLTPFSLAQIATRFNRPDQVLARMGYGDQEHLEALRAQWRRRLELLGLDEQVLTRRATIEPPRVRVGSTSPKQGRVELTLYAADRVGLASYQVRVNGVPVLGEGRERVLGRRHRARHTLDLTDGQNVIEVSALSSRGIESERVKIRVDHEDEAPPHLYFVGLGVSEYDDPGIQDLKYAHEDASDMSRMLDGIHAASGYGAFKAFVPTHGELTRDVLVRVRAFVAQAHPRDTVIVMVSGHGTYSREASPRYFFIVRDTDPTALVDTGVALEDLEEVLATTRARKRVMLMDTCASGDLADSTLRRRLNDPVDGGNQRGITARSFSPVPLVGATTTPKAAREWVYQRRFIHHDLANRTGATVLSSSRGFELSWESDEWKNGAFTEALLEGMSGKADLDGTNGVSLRELASYVEGRTAALTRGKQHPVVDRDNPSLEVVFGKGMGTR